MAKMSKKAAEECLKSVGIDPKGIDWSKINWTKIFEIIKAVISLFGSAPQAQRAIDESADGCTLESCCKAHFEAIGELAACGAACCCVD